MKPFNDSFFSTVRSFLTIYLPKQKCCSPNTVKSYRMALNLLIDFLLKEKKTPIYAISFDLLNHSTINEFLEWLQTDRKCTPSTCNQRLMALRSFTKYAGIMDVSQISIQNEIKKVPYMKVASTIVEFLSEQGLKSLLEQPDIKKPLGVRDRFFMILMYDTAARCQELLDLKLNDFELNTKNPYIYLHGKGSKTRTVPIMSKTAEHYLFYLDKFHPDETRNKEDYVFYTTIHGQKNQMSPDNVAAFMKRYGNSAKATCSDIPPHIHPHQLRHTRAIHLYRGGMPLPLLAEFLGHVNLNTTQVYAYADTEMKRAAIQKACPQSISAPSAIPLWENDEEMIRKLYGLL